MLAKLMKSRPYQIICTILLGLVLLGLPVTSLPLISQFTGSMVAPFSAIPLAILILIWFVPFLIRKGKLPKEIIPLLYFVLVALIISAGSFFLDGFYTRDRTFFDQSLRAFVTLGVGLSFYLTLSAYLDSESILRTALRLISLSGVWLILWSIYEIILLQVHGTVGNFPLWVLSLKAFLAYQIPGLEYLNRVSGFAYEPSWYALYFTLVLFPLWFSSVFQRKSLFKVRLWVFIIEDLLLVLGIVCFAFSFPRVGMLAFFVMLFYLGVRLVNQINHKIFDWASKRNLFKIKNPTLLKTLISVLLILLVIAIIVGATAAFIEIASRSDYRYQLIIDQLLAGTFRNFSFSEEETITLARRLAFYERTIFWFSGWHVFADYPFGVGLGNAGFYMIERFNSQGYGSFEIRNLIYQANHIINTKSLWIRLLAETGFIGLGIYLTWLILLWRKTNVIQQSASPLMKVIGLAGKLFILAYLVEGFSVDSFAIPFQWVTASLISAGGLVVLNRKREESPSTERDPVIQT